MATEETPPTLSPSHPSLEQTDSSSQLDKASPLHENGVSKEREPHSPAQVNDGAGNSALSPLPSKPRTPSQSLPVDGPASPSPAASSTSPPFSPVTASSPPPTNGSLSPPKSPAPVDEEEPERPQHRKHANDDIWDKKWATRRKHIFVLTNTGRPIYCRYGDESKLSSIMGILSTLAAIVEGNNNDTIRCVVAGDLKVVFLMDGPIFLVAVGRGDQPEYLLRKQLHYINYQLLSAITSGVHKILTQRPNFDVRNTLGGADRFLDEIVYATEQQVSLQLGGVHMLRIEPLLRGYLTKGLTAAAHPDLTFSLVITGFQLLQYVCPANHPLQPSDIHVVMNTINSSPSFREKESWTMICLPVFERRGFMYAYICYFTPSVALVLLSPKQGAFYDMAKCKRQFMGAIAPTPEQLPQVLELLEARASKTLYPVHELRLSSLLHFIYKDRRLSQITMPALGAPYTNINEAKRLKRRYQLLHHRVYSPASGPHKIYYHCSSAETVLVWQTFGFDLYATFTPWETKSNCIVGCNRLLNWVKQEEKHLFALHPPVY